MVCLIGGSCSVHRSVVEIQYYGFMNRSLFSLHMGEMVEMSDGEKLFHFTDHNAENLTVVLFGFVQFIPASFSASKWRFDN